MIEQGNPSCANLIQNMKLKAKLVLEYTFFKLIVLNLIMRTSVSTCEQVSSSFMVIRVHIICMLNIDPRCNFKCAKAMHFHMSLSEK